MCILCAMMDTDGDDGNHGVLFEKMIGTVVWAQLKRISSANDIKTKRPLIGRLMAGKTKHNGVVCGERLKIIPPV